MTTGSIELPC